MTFIEYFASEDCLGKAVGIPGWYAHNQEYATRIQYCPMCGVRLEKPEQA
jgi:hypothetical protein